MEYRCDEPMAEKMGIKRYCNKMCVGCFCAIKKDAFGQEEHVGVLSQPSGVFAKRNLDVMSGIKISGVGK